MVSASVELFDCSFWECAKLQGPYSQHICVACALYCIFVHTMLAIALCMLLLHEDSLIQSLQEICNNGRVNILILLYVHNYRFNCVVSAWTICTGVNSKEPKKA